MAMKLPGFLPEDLRQLARFVPLRGWDAIEWKPMLGSLRTVSLQMLSSRGAKKLAGVTAEYSDVLLQKEFTRSARPLESLTAARDRKKLGDQLLSFYFQQWLVPQGLFIDLRPARVALDGAGQLEFRTSGLWIKLRPEFRLGMVDLYKSFYSSDETAFEDALRRMGMLREGLSASEESELKELLHAHFGIDQRAQRFSIDSFKASFDELFRFFTEHQYTLHSDFVYVGFYLITLYLSLEEGGQSHNVRKLCADALLDQ